LQYPQETNKEAVPARRAAKGAANEIVNEIANEIEQVMARRAPDRRWKQP
jgi:hypothetical protein